MSDVERFRQGFARLLLLVLWINVGLLALAPLADPLLDRTNLIVAGAGLAALSLLVWRICGTDWPTRQVTSIATMGQVMLLVYGFAGHPYQSDMHMYFFAMLAVLAGWLDWRIFIPTTVAIVCHHFILSLAQPAGVFPNGNDGGRVLLHGAIVMVQAAALSWLVTSFRGRGEARRCGNHGQGRDRKAKGAARRRP